MFPGMSSSLKAWKLQSSQLIECFLLSTVNQYQHRNVLAADVDQTMWQPIPTNKTYFQNQQTTRPWRRISLRLEQKWNFWDKHELYTHIHAKLTPNFDEQQRGGPQTKLGRPPKLDLPRPWDNIASGGVRAYLALA